ncbi:MAG TPA: zinc-binding dehydrogenase [Acidimicrobiales bacterium]|nr:zinc-binding dehydrogenase [Acidimicrobiales bacterium]
MKALLFERSLPRYAAARVASSVAPGSAARLGPLHLTEVEEPALPGPDWRRVSPILAGICGSDLATVEGHSSRYFEPIVSFPFVPGHEVVGELADGGPDDGARVVIEPVLGCTARGIAPLCDACAGGHTGNCERVAYGHLKPGLQTGYCSDTGGGWSSSLVAHRSQIHLVPDSMSDEEAVMVEPTACGIHAALAAADPDLSGPGLSAATVAVIGAGTLGLTVIAALRRFLPPALLLAGAKHPEQCRLAASLGADQVLDPDGLVRGVRRHTRSLANGAVLTGGADVVIDCVGNAESIDSALSMVRPKGRVVLAGMPGTVKLDLTSLWNREVSLSGAYAYGLESVPGRAPARTFDLAFELVAEAGLGQLVGARYPLDRFPEAIAHASAAGRLGAVKVVFDLRPASRRPTWRSA